MKGARGKPEMSCFVTFGKSEIYLFTFAPVLSMYS